jgi:hypothetical protein
MLKKGRTMVPLRLISMTTASIQAGCDNPPKAFRYNAAILFKNKGLKHESS